MPTHIVLLRGINVGGHKRVAMPALRDLVRSLGHTDVTSYIQSGNVLFTTDRTDTAALAAELEQAIATSLGVEAGVVVLTRDELAQVMKDNPYPDEPNPKFVHAVFLRGDPAPEMVQSMTAAQRRAAQKGSRDSATAVGRVIFVHTPDGFGTSEFVKLLGRAGGPMSAQAAGTARNWSTVTKLLALCDG
jgi:uncharacterized protein (DUF1697 family)